MQEIIDYADFDTLRTLSLVSRSFRQAACRRLRPLEHFDLRAAEVPESIHKDLTAWYLYELTGVGVRVLADAMHFHWGMAGADWHEFEGNSPIPEAERGHKWTFEYYDAEEEVYECPKGDGRVDSFEEIPAGDMAALRRARVLDIAYPLDRPEVFLSMRLMPNLHTMRLLPLPPGVRTQTLHSNPPVARIVFFDLPGRWLKPVLTQTTDWSGKFDLCSAQTSKVVIHQTHRRKGRLMDAMFPPVPRAPPAQLKTITYIFQRWDPRDDDARAAENAEGTNPTPEEQSAEDATNGENSDRPVDIANGAHSGPNNGSDDARHRPLNFFIGLAVWAAGHGVELTVVGAQDLDPLVFEHPLPQALDETKQGCANGEKSGAQDGQAGDDTRPQGVVRHLMCQVLRCAALRAAEPTPGMPTGDLVAKVRANVHFVTRDAYRASIGEEEFDIETNIDYFKRRGVSQP